MRLIDRMPRFDGPSRRFFVFDYDETIAKVPVDWAASRPGCRDHLAAICPGIEMPQGIRMDEMEAIALEANPSRKTEIFDFRARLEAAATGSHAPYPDVISLIKDLADDADAKLFILSNNLRQTILEGLRALEIEHLFVAILGVDDVGAPKPSVQGKQILVDQFGVIPDYTVFVGDSPATDGVFASKANFKFVNIKEIATYE
jgi:HAD superfamily hydrolase (TIGR01549 family)